MMAWVLRYIEDKEPVRSLASKTTREELLVIDLTMGKENLAERGVKNPINEAFFIC